MEDYKIDIMIESGPNARTHGDKKLINPAPNAINNSIIKYYSANTFMFCLPRLSIDNSKQLINYIRLHIIWQTYQKKYKELL